MKKAKILSLITTIINTLAAVLGVIVSAFAYYALTDAENITNQSMNHVSEIDSESITSGYEVLGAAFASAFGVFAAGLIMMILIIFIIFSLFYIVPSMFGISALIRTRKKNDESKRKIFRSDGIFKIIFDGFPLLFIMLGLAAGGNFPFYLICFIIMVAIEALNIWQTVICCRESYSLSYGPFNNK